MSQKGTSLHEEERLITKAGLQVFPWGGCEETPRIQGCMLTSMARNVPAVLQMGEGGSAVPEFNSLLSSSTDVDPSGERSGTTTAKRVVLLLNVSPGQQATATCEAAGLTVVSLQRFGSPLEPSSTLMAAKKMIREGRVIWLHGRVRPHYWSKPTWFTQCCRLAHRAMAQWTLEFTQTPWHVKPFEALRRHKYVQHLGTTGSTNWYGSEGVNPQTTQIEQVLEQAARAQCPTGDAARWLGAHTDTQDEMTKRGIRRAEDKAAIGGLRSPHKSVLQITGATAFGKWLEDRLCSVVHEGDSEALAATRTLGDESLPQVVVELAREVRKKLCDEFQIAQGPDSTLQGQLIAELAEKLNDPDVPVKEWLRRGTVPLGIQTPIEAGGAFPNADPVYPEVDTDLSFWLENYASFSDHQRGAEEILEKERAAGWLEWNRSRKFLEDKYGPDYTEQDRCHRQTETRQTKIAPHTRPETVRSELPGKVH